MTVHVTNTNFPLRETLCLSISILSALTSDDENYMPICLANTNFRLVENFWLFIFPTLGSDDGNHLSINVVNTWGGLDLAIFRVLGVRQNSHINK